MRRLFLGSLCLIMLYLTIVSAAEKYSKIQIRFNDREEFIRLAHQGLPLDPAEYRKEPAGGFSIIVLLNEQERRILEDIALPFEVLAEDAAQAYRDKPRLSALQKQQIFAASEVSGFEFGSMGGYYTYDEVITELDSMRLLYPHLISDRQSIGQSWEGRDLWMVRISDNPDNDEDEPEVLYTGLHHAREPMGMMCLMYFMNYLLENYGSDAEATYLVDNREMYFIPVVNPDGYVYNEQENPQGGGQWRKNRRDNDGPFEGVDLNRNYGYQWGYDDVGSSPYSYSDTYRGPEAFSEPETQSVRDFCFNRYFALALNYHTYSNLLIYPYSYEEHILTPDSLLYMEYAADMTEFNHYRYGTGYETVEYLVNGNSDDWMYGEQALKNKILAMTPEVGSSSDGFWPEESRIYPLAEENLPANLYLAWAGGGLVKLKDFSLWDVGDQNGYPDPGETVQLVCRVKNIGQESAFNVRMGLYSNDPYIQINSPSGNPIGEITAQTTLFTDTLEFNVSYQAPQGYQPEIFLEFDIDGGIRRDTLRSIIIGTPAVLFADNAESGVQNWETGSGWNTTDALASEGQYSFTDSPQDRYSDNADNSLTLLDPVSIPETSEALFLKFQTRWDIEHIYDFALVECSTDGQSWTNYPGLFTVRGSGEGVQNTSSSGYEGIRNAWAAEQIDLSELCGSDDVYIRFRMRSDGGVREDGWYLDYIRLLAYSPAPSDYSMPAEPVAGSFILRQNYPNPFNAGTVIVYQLPSAARVELTVFNLLGEKIRTLVSETQNAGQKTVIWDGTDNRSRKVSSGVYFYHLKTADHSGIKKMLVIN